MDHGSNGGRMRFGAFFAPFHSEAVNPTLAFERDFELIEWLDRLTYDEAWVGEHHSGAYECIASPEVFLAIAGERTRHIRLATGVSSLAYHHPLVLADRIAQLDHHLRGRLIFGVGPGQLVADAYMMGIDPATLRRKMDESLDCLVRLLNGETCTRETDWFTLREARCQILPYQAPTVEMAVASAISPTGARAAGKYGIGMISVAASSPEGFRQLANHWSICEEKAREHGRQVSRANWRIVTPFHIAETREQALEDLRFGLMDMMRYFRKFGGSAFPVASSFEEALSIWTSGGLGAFGVGVVGTPDDLIAHIRKLEEQSGGFGAFLSLAHNAADFTATKKSYELFARHVMPHFQTANRNRGPSLEWAAANADRFMTSYVGGIQEAIRAHEEEVARRNRAAE
ncbi:LLM class flavin-dependent oxidoreductase [Flavisphingomonas formosensis]|uniref:LLM class flavin-dependent oxidoreductase n=1 Tax=Flavisphingomonas formosensis TaxID=861534 RepID=UPI0018DF9292|nr:LLM class flavin-dependent oxidoreductase [Sphingomonas formosensis]